MNTKKYVRDKRERKRSRYEKKLDKENISTQSVTTNKCLGKRQPKDLNEGNGGRSRKRERLEYPLESKEGCDSLVILNERLDMIANFVEKNRVGLLRSPPSSGKTALGQVLRDYFIDCNHIGIYISLASLGGRGAINEKFFEEFWVKEVGYTWTQISDSTGSIFYVFIDEIQTIYGDCAIYFWTKIKALISSECTKNIHILLLGTYDPVFANVVTPIRFSASDTLSLKSLLLTKNEFKLLVKKYIYIRGSIKFKIPEAVRDAIFCLTNGHAGLCRFILDSLYTKYKDGNTYHKDRILTVEMLRYLASPNLSSLVSLGSRAFYWIDNWKPSEEEAGFIRNQLFISKVGDSYSVDYNSITNHFVRIGLFTFDSGQIQFTAPIMRIVLSHHLFTSPLPKSPATSFNDFLIRTIERISPTKLSESLGKGKGRLGRLFERQWQMEWYRSATTVVPVGTSVSADVGPVFGSAGFLDFYVSGECWGIELAREGNLLNRHAQRFMKDVGKYKEIPLKKWIILDFRHHSKQIKDFKPNFWYVAYSDDYKTVSIKYKNKDRIIEKKLDLQGDNV